jgi:hypothetical protein
MCGTGRSPLIRVLDNAHLDWAGDGRLHKDYAVWILAAEYSERSGRSTRWVQPVVRDRIGLRISIRRLRHAYRRR